MKQLLISALVLAGLGGAIWWSNKQEDAKKDQPNSKGGPQILKLEEIDIQGIEVERKGEVPTVLSRDAAGKWTIASPGKLAADMQVVPAITLGASRLFSERVVDEKPSQLDAYGLQPPDTSVKFTMKDGKTHRIMVGEETPDKSGAYAMVEGDPKLYTIAASARDTFNKSAMDLRDKHLMSLDMDKLTKAELNVQGKTPIEFAKVTNDAGSQWQITKPRAYRADSVTVQELLSQINGAQIDPMADEKASQAAFNSGKPFASLKLSLDGGAQAFEVRQSDGEYYARSGSVPGAWKIASEVAEALNKKLEDFQNKKLFDFAFDDPSQIEIKMGGDTKIIAKTKGKDGTSVWLSNGRTMDSVSVQNVIDKLRELGASRIDDVNPRAPEIEITVTSKDGKRVETVKMAPAGPDFLARRNGEELFYRIDGSVISDLKGAVTALREADPAKDLKDLKKK